MNTQVKEVRFDIYCKKCVYKDMAETEEPCNECLTQGYNYESKKPVKYEPKSNNA